MKKHHLHLVLRLLIAIILIQTLRFKFTAHPDSVYIFETVGLEPVGRIGIGILELIAGIALIFRKTAWFGGLLAMGLMAGAIFMHLSMLGIEVKGDGGLLFATAVVTFILSSLVAFIYRKDIPLIGKRF